MNERDKLYQTFREAEETRKRKNFDIFMDSLTEGLVDNLNAAYKSGDTEEYQRLIRTMKQKGIRIFRNDDGDHKVKYM